ncbi:MAG: tetratricopeptide repeat protein, partial [bacterium]
LVVLVADHGESLGEHKENTHGIFIYDTTVRVPLILRYPGLPQGMVSSHPVKTLDILPTVLEMLNIPPPQGLEGESLLNHLGRLEPDQRKEAAIFLETRFPEINFGWSRLQGIRNRRWKYIQAPRPELYDLEKDPQERYNVINQYPQQVRSLREILRSFTETHPPVSRSLYTPMDRTTRERLQSLGYVWADSSKPLLGHEKDPKDMIEVLNLFDEGSRLYTEERYSEAISFFRRVVQKNPENILARFLLASAQKKVGRLEEAIEEFQQVAALNPRFINVHNCLGNIYEEMAEYEKAALEYRMDMKLHPQVPLSYNNLGGVYLKQGRYQEAQEQFEKVLLLEPDRTTRIVTHSNLGIAWEMMGLYDRAQQAYQSSLDLDPDYLPARMGLGNIFLKKNQMDRAVREWQKALDIFPQNAEAHFNLGCTFLGMRRMTEAVDHLQEAIRLQPNLLQARVLLQRIQTQGQL